MLGDYDFMFRRYNPVQGRWMSPDPAGLAAVDSTNPQTWNRYSYVANNPLNYVDPLGLMMRCDFDVTIDSEGHVFPILWCHPGPNPHDPPSEPKQGGGSKKPSGAQTNQILAVPQCLSSQVGCPM